MPVCRACRLGRGKLACTVPEVDIDGTWDAQGPGKAATWAQWRLKQCAIGNRVIVALKAYEYWCISVRDLHMEVHAHSVGLTC